MAVLSNKQDVYVKGLIEQLFPDGEIELAMGQATLPMKPDPTVPTLIAHQLCVDLGECAMIGDSDVDVQTAQNAGMRSVGCAWGYRGRQALLDAGAQVVVDHPSELLDCFPPLTDESSDGTEQADLDT